MPASASFDQSVFINCPYDQSYYELLRPLVFTVLFGRLVPRLALERMDSGTPRVQKIVELVRGSKFAIHDLSRIQAEEVGEYFRLNMPFELGLDVGCREFGGGQQGKKRCLVLAQERYGYRAAISDLAGSDISAHGDDPEELVAILRDWLNLEADAGLPGPSRIWGGFNEFMADDYVELTERGFSDKDIQRLPIPELVRHMQTWLSTAL